MIVGNFKKYAQHVRSVSAQAFLLQTNPKQRNKGQENPTAEGPQNPPSERGVRQGEMAPKKDKQGEEEDATEEEEEEDVREEEEEVDEREEEEEVEEYE